MRNIAGRVLVQGAVLAVLLAPLWMSGCASRVTFGSLLHEMDDLEALAVLPDPPYTNAQFSSYDPRSVNWTVPTDEDWFANGDRGHHLRQEERNGQTEFVLLDADGPGAIVRIWSANPNDAGIVRVYLDHHPDPVIEMPLTEMLGGGETPFLQPISGVRGRGWNTFLPIPYAEHCKVTTSQHDYYYHVNYRTYAPGTQVETFTMDQVAQNAALIEDRAHRLAHPEVAPDYPDRGRLEAQMLGNLGPGESLETQLDGPAAIREFHARLSNTPDIEKALRGCLLEITFDDAPNGPQVAVPLGDFFGSAPGVNPYLSIPSGMTSDGWMYSRWVMPYRRSARIRFTNHTDQPFDLEGKMLALDRKWTRDSLHFHAKWRQEVDIPTHPRRDWNYIWVGGGAGRFVGGSLQVTNPVQGWWGEGDEKIYVDGERFPSTFGTGTEDYYGYAWCDNTVFTHAYHNQPRCDGPGNFGYTSVNRFHIIDDIPFTDQFRFDMEVWHWVECKLSLAVVSLYYAEPGTVASLGVPAAADLIVPPLPELYRVKGALEAEKMEARVTGGRTQVQSGGFGDIWSNGSQLWWTGGRPGDTLTLGFQAPEAGRYAVSAVFTQAADYGVASLFINDQKVGEMDFYNDGVVATDPVSLGEVELEEGLNTFQARITGANPDAVQAHMFGIDYLLLQPVE